MNTGDRQSKIRRNQPTPPTAILRENPGKAKLKNESSSTSTFAEDHLPDGVFAFDRYWRCTHVNSAAGQFIGKPSQEMIGHTPWESFPEAMQLALSSASRRTETTGEPTQSQVSHPPSIDWAEISVFPVGDGYTVVLRDITRRKRAEAALRESEARFRAVWEATSEAMALSDPDGTVLAANPAYLQLYGLAESEVVGNSFAVIFPEEQRASAEQQYREVFNGPNLPRAYETHVRLKDGAERIVETRADFVVDDGRRIAMVSAIRDVTDRHAADRVMRKSEERLQRAIAIDTVGVLFFNLNRGITDANAAFARMSGYSHEELLRLDWEVLTPPEFMDATACAAEELATLGETEPYEKQLIRKDGSRWWSLCAPTRLGGSGRNSECVEFILDISEQKQAEAERETFAAIAAHDLRTPLTTLRGQAQLLLRRASGGQPVDAATITRRMRVIVAVIDRMVAMVDEMLDAAHLRAGRSLDLNAAPVDLVALAEVAAQEARLSASRHGVRVAAALPQLVGEWDGARLARVLSNLLGNAIKYSPAGGDIVVEVGREEDPTRSWAVVSVTDQGIGIPAADVPYLFERFRRGGNVTGRIAGTGIGLAGAKQIVEQHGGTITVDSQEGKGATFFVRLPLNQGGAH